MALPPNPSQSRRKMSFLWGRDGPIKQGSTIDDVGWQAARPPRRGGMNSPCGNFRWVLYRSPAPACDHALEIGAPA